MEGIRFSLLCAACLWGLPLLWGCFLEGLGSPTNPPARPHLSPLLPGGRAIQHAVLPPVLPFGRIKPPCTCTHAPIILLHASTDIYTPTLISYPIQYASPLHSPHSSHQSLLRKIQTDRVVQLHHACMHACSIVACIVFLIFLLFGFL